MCFVSVFVVFCVHCFVAALLLMCALSVRFAYLAFYWNTLAPTRNTVMTNIGATSVISDKHVLSVMSDVSELSDSIAIHDWIAASDMSCMRHTRRHRYTRPIRTTATSSTTSTPTNYCLYVREGVASSADCLPLLVPMQIAWASGMKKLIQFFSLTLAAIALHSSV